MRSANGTNILVLDGGMGQELRRRNIPSPDGLWSAQALISHPDAVLEIHRDYIVAGADIITTNSYSCVRPELAAAGIEDKTAELNQLAGALARKAADSAGRSILVAGSLPPMFSYRPDLAEKLDTLPDLYNEQAELLAPYVDVFLCETMGSGEEARLAATAAAATGKPVWVSWTLQDHGSAILRSGETIADAAKQLSLLDISAFLVNCCSPESISAAMPTLAKLGRAGGYANGFAAIPEGWTSDDTIDALGHRHDLTPERYTSIVMDWVNAGASIVGGCCEIGPEHIAALRKALFQGSIQSA